MCGVCIVNSDRTSLRVVELVQLGRRGGGVGALDKVVQHCSVLEEQLAFAPGAKQQRAQLYALFARQMSSDSGSAGRLSIDDAKFVG